MAISFGFVSICLSEDNCSPAGTVTAKSVENLDLEGRRRRIRATARRNLDNTRRIMFFLRAHRIPLYRMSAQLIPLATHPATEGWDWWDDPELRPLMAQIGEYVARYGLRVSSHLPQLCLLTAADPAKLLWTEKYLAYHRRLFDGMGLDEGAKIVMHLGGAYGDRAEALRRAIAYLRQLPEWARKRLCLENDDRDPRAHADYVDVAFVRPALEAARRLGDFDVMVEAKKKDLALFKLRDELAELGLVRVSPPLTPGRG